MLLLFFAFLFALLVAIFAVQNAVFVTVSFLFWSFQTSLVLVVLGAATFGAMAVLSLASLAQFRLRRTLRRARQRLGEMEAEVATLQARFAEAREKGSSGDVQVISAAEESEKSK